MTQRTKNIVMIIGFVAIFVVGYRLAISKTLELRSDINAMKTQSLAHKNLAQLSVNLEQKERYLDSILKRKNLTNTSLQSNLLAFLTQESEERGFTISAFNEPHVLTADNLTTTSYTFSLRGSYKQLETVLFELEQIENFGSVTHVAFEKKRDHRKRTTFLEVDVIISTVE